MQTAKRYKVYLVLQPEDGIWVEVEANNKAEAQFCAFTGAWQHISEAEAHPHWKVVPSKTRMIKEKNESDKN